MSTNKFSNPITIILTVIFMDLLTGMEFDLFVPSFSQLQHFFSVAPVWIEALLSVNFIGYCLSLFIVGYLADRYGRRSIILSGLLLFIVGTLCCLLTNTYLLLLLGRFLQGLGIAAPAILSFLLIADRFSLEKQQFWMAMLNGSFNLAAGIAPVIGSYIAFYFHWRGNFSALLLLGVLAFVMSLLFVPNDVRQTSSTEIGYRNIFRKKSLLLLMITLVVMFVPYWIFVGISPLLYIKSLHISLPAFGFYQGVLAFTFALGSLLFGVMLRYCSQRTWLSFGIGLFALALIMMIWLVTTNNTDPKLITGAMLVFVIAQIIPSAILYPLCLQLMPEAKAKISAVLQGARLILSALSLEIAGYFYQGNFQSTGIIIILFLMLIVVTQLFIVRKKANGQIPL